MSGSYDGNIVRALQRWLVESDHSDEKDKALAGEWEKMEGLEAGDEDLTRAWDKLRHNIEITAVEKTEEKETERKVVVGLSFRKISAYMAAAALACVIAASGWFFGREYYGKIQMSGYYTEAAELGTVLLPDGSVVKTNASTTLIYPEKFVGKTRKVFLVGEASFSVKADPEHPFIVDVGAVEVKALGTEFNVSAYSDNEKIVTTLMKGKVNVLCDNEDCDVFTLAPGQQMSYGRTSGKGVVTEVDVDDFTAWQRGVLVLKSQTIQEVLAALHHKYNVSFRYMGGCDKNDRYTFRFKSDDSIEQVLDVISAIVDGFEYHLEDNVCTVRID